uniref:hypothetical protein n=1 Tax=Spathularia flavida TaxID=33158 RepID=UPI0022DCE217|nr:hypothetical protein PEX43_mgp07 [Spathularia flavida]UZT67626.1 hypothetical protein [Spathularia flavida]
MGNITKIIDIENKSVSNSLVNLNLNSIKLKENNYNFKLQLNTANPFIGSFDIETYLDEGISKVYALGFYTKQHGTKTFYIDENSLNSEELILKCLESMISSQNDKYTFYVHNLGRYDIYFLLNILVKSDKYSVNILARDDLILSVSINSNYTKTKSVKDGKPKKGEIQKYKDVDVNIKYQIKLVDSYNILSHSLDTLAKTS